MNVVPNNMHKVLAQPLLRLWLNLLRRKIEPNKIQHIALYVKIIQFYKRICIEYNKNHVITPNI